MPFAGAPAQARAALAALGALRLRDGDVVVLADNSQTAPAAGGDRVRVVAAPGEASPSHARNAGAAAATGPDWLLFLDADTRPAPDLLDAYFPAPVPDGVGALAGEVAALPGRDSLAARYGAARNFLDTGVHLAHPFRPRLAAANLLVRRAAFDAVGGFQEGIRAAEDTDLCWRLQDAGWELGLAPGARVQHAYRPTLRALRAQWRGYAAGRAWLRRRYPGFTPEPALLRAARRLPDPRPAVRAPSLPGGAAAEPMGQPISRSPRGSAPAATITPLRPATAAALDGVLGLEELLGLTLANRPRGAGRRPIADTVVVAERFPVAGTEPAQAVGVVRVEAGARPAGPAATRADPAITVDYREDDGALERLTAAARLTLIRPRAVLRDRRGPGPPLRELAPAALRLRRDRGAWVRPVAAPADERVAARLRALAGAPSG